MDWFPDEESCHRFLERLRWPDGFVCPRCGAQGDPYRATRHRLMCRACRAQCSVTAGTVFDKTRTPLRSWFAAVWYATNQKHGVSALGLQRVLGLGSYQTAWMMLHRLRRAMIRPIRVGEKAAIWAWPITWATSKQRVAVAGSRSTAFQATRRSSIPKNWCGAMSNAPALRGAP